MLTITARSPEDLLAAVPVLLGFAPQDSLVMVTLGKFHARVDLPLTSTDTETMVQALLRPVLAHEVKQVFIVTYAEDVAAGQRAAHALGSALTRHAVEVLAVLHADGRRYFHGADTLGRPYDVSTHAIAAEAVADGRVTAPSRQALADRLAPDTARMITPSHAADADPDLNVETRWAHDVILGAVTRDERLDNDTAARLLLSTATSNRVRDGILAAVTRANSTVALEVLSDLLRRAPRVLRPQVAILVAYTAWLNGNGALAWVAHEEADPTTVLSEIVRELLTSACNPADWPGLSINDVLGEG